MLTKYGSRLQKQDLGFKPMNLASVRLSLTHCLWPPRGNREAEVSKVSVEIKMEAGEMNALCLKVHSVIQYG